jgi:hypothetical protein
MKLFLNELFEKNQLEKYYLLNEVFSCGDPLEVKTRKRTFKGTIEHDGQDYYFKCEVSENE